MGQTEFEAIICSRRQARENARVQVTIGLGFAFHWLKAGASFANQSQSEVKQKQMRVTFNPPLVLGNTLI